MDTGTRDIISYVRTCVVSAVCRADGRYYWNGIMKKIKIYIKNVYARVSGVAAGNIQRVPHVMRCGGVCFLFFSFFVKCFIRKYEFSIRRNKIGRRIRFSRGNAIDRNHVIAIRSFSPRFVEWRRTLYRDREYFSNTFLGPRALFQI